MTLAAPWGLAAAALAVPLTLWYVLRARRPRLEVSSVFLWRQTDRSVAAAVPWQRFRPDRTYWFILLAILAGALALARPTIAAPAALGDHTIVLLDTSASMSADEDGPTRLELARRQARELVGRMGPGQVVSVIEAGPRARVVLASSGDGAAAGRALARIAPTGGAADLADAFTLAASLQRPGEQTVTHLFTDGPVDAGAAALAPPGLVIDGVGTDRPNLAVTRLQALPGGGGGAQAFVQLRNLGQLPSAAVLTLTLDEAEVARRNVDLGPRGSEDLIVDIASQSNGTGVLRATVRPRAADPAEAAAADAMAGDNTAHALLAGPRDVQAVVAGPGNIFVESALAAVEGVEVRTTPVLPEDLSDVDLLVVDRLIAPVQPTVPTLYIAPRRAPRDVTLEGTTELPSLTFQDPASEVLTDVDLSGVAISEAQRVNAPTLQTLASGPAGPLLLAGRLGGTPVVYLPFALSDSNLPLQVAWPVLAANTVTWLAGPPTTLPAVAGTNATVPAPVGVASIEVESPAGDVQRIDPIRPVVRVDLPGIWRVRYPAAVPAVAETALAVNTDPDESDLSRGQPVPLEAQGDRTGGPATPNAGRRSLSPYLLIVPLVLLVADALWPRGRRGASRPGRRSRRRRRPSAAPAGVA